MLSKNSSVSRRNASRRLSSKSGNRFTTGSLASSARTFSHWPVKLATSACGPRIRQHAPHLLLEHGWILQLALRGELDQFVVGNAAPQEERQPRRQLEIADAIALARRPVRQARFSAIDEFRIRQDALQRRFDAFIEVAAFASARRDRTPSTPPGPRGCRPAEGMFHERRNDLRAQRFLRRARWPDGTRKSCDGSAVSVAPVAPYGPSIETWPTCG